MIENLYILLIFMLGIITNNANIKHRRNYIVASSLILILISGLRNIYWGPDDTYNYYQYYNMVCNMEFHDIPNNFWKDPSYHYFAKVISTIIGSNFTNYLLVIAMCFIGVVGWIIYKESRNPLLSFILFISLGIFGFSMIGVRQSLAQAMVLLSYKYVKERNLKLFFLLILIGALFHKTALIFLLVYPICRLKFNKFTVAAYIVIVVYLMTAGRLVIQQYGSLLLFDDRFAGYLESDKSLSAAGIIQMFLFLVLFLKYYKTAVEYNRDFRILLHILFLAIVFQTMAVVIAEFFRVAWYFKMFLIIMIPNILEYSQYKKLVTNTLYILLLFYFIFMLADKHDYVFFWQQYSPNFVTW